MTIGNVLDVFLRSGRDVETTGEATRIGAGLIIHSEVVQLDEEAAALLRTSPVQANRIDLRDGLGRAQAVARIRPGLLDYHDTAEIVAARLDGLPLLPVDGDLVFLELHREGDHEDHGDHDADGDDDCEPPVGDPWYCLFICASDCSNC